MGKPILLLRLEGPLQSWGARARWSRRDTGPEPTKSGVLGLLGCAAGVLRPDWRSGEEPDRTLEEWDRDLRFAVRVDRTGVIETDYHTVQGQHWQADGKMKTAAHPSGATREQALLEPPHTEITWRDYIHDAAFLVALEEREAKGLLEKLKGHLEHPKWPVFLGRKSCVPSRPILDRMTEDYADIEDALNREPWAAPQFIADLRCYVQNGPHPPCSQCKRHGPPTNLSAWIEDNAGDHERPDALRLNQLRFYDFRRCRRVDVPSDSLEWRIR
ncbi:MAG TPA: type I-E CRISPR-associated protein Cas5/CasD [Fimbriimonadaceae bacterium]|nr:type I-E CRISPR-associated protein Cas5/CasD [Fimbriimonadaceae bacterium]